MDCSPPGAPIHGDSPAKNTGVGCHAVLQRLFPTQGLNPGLLHCRWILYQLNYKGSPRILEWVVYPFPADLPNPRLNWSLLHCRRTLYPLSHQGSRSMHLTRRLLCGFFNAGQMLSPHVVCISSLFLISE